MDEPKPTPRLEGHEEAQAEERQAVALASSGMSLVAALNHAQVVASGGRH
jgi:hypothetical protein